jgi:hypothetical protein
MDADETMLVSTMNPYSKRRFLHSSEYGGEARPNDVDVAHVSCSRYSEIVSHLEEGSEVRI